MCSQHLDRFLLMMPAYGTIDSNEENYRTKLSTQKGEGGGGGGGQNKRDKEAINQDDQKKQVKHQ